MTARRPARPRPRRAAASGGRPDPDRSIRGRLLKVLERFSGIRLAVWGDLVVDEFVVGAVNRISREAPVLILDLMDTTRIPGGAANTVANIAAVGATPLPVGVVGDDDWGRDLLRLLAARGVDTSGIQVEAGLTTPTKSRISGAGLHTTRQQIVRVDRGGPYALAPARRRALARAAAAAAEGSSGLVLADYGYGAIEPAAGRRLARRLRQAGRVVAVDSRWRLLQFKGVSTATPNEPELEAAVGISLRGEDEDALARAGLELRRRLDCETLLVTRGRRGMAVFQASRSTPALLPVFGTDEVADVTGAGDTVMAVYTVALAAGATPVDAARLANYAGGLVVMKQGTATVSRQELARAVEADT